MANEKPAGQSIAVNGRFLSQAVTGVQRYAVELMSAIDRLLSTRQIEPVPVTVYVPPDARIAPAWKTVCVERIGRFTGQFWEQIDLASRARGSLLFTPCGGAPVVHPHQVITIHDAAIFRTPEAYTAIYRNYYKVLQRVLARKAEHLITVSQFSRRELIECLCIPVEKISTTWNSGEHILGISRDNSILEKHGFLHSRSYVLGVGSRNVNKNLNRLVEAFNILDDHAVDLVIAGESNRAIFGESGNYSQRVKEIGFVSDGELRALYENAACFVFPSLYEGFGIPPLEALTLGTPVIVSRAAALPEVFGDSAVYCDPHAPLDIAEKIRGVLQGKIPDRNAAQLRASQFTWEECARKTWKILVSALN
jgi:glycosyltransferase involved in cell wall biosynthesis